jgi:hypothetical protein
MLCGCSAESRLAGRAANYYSYMAGHNPNTKFSTYLSPAYRTTLGKDGQRTYDTAVKPGAEGKVRYPVAKGGDVATHIEGRFALTSANPALGDVYKNQRSTRWVRVGQSWYLYWNSDAEVKAYGAFPVGMKPPVYGEKSKQQ